MHNAGEPLQIGICRVICIFFMMSVHVRFSSDSLISTGDLAWLGYLWVEQLGRASVAALSLISGYLLIRTTAGRSFGQMAWKKFQTLIIPMLFWNLLYCGLLVAKAFLFHLPYGERLVGPGVSIVGALTGFNGGTANLSLFFLRDLFVASLIVFLLAPALRRWPVPVLAAIAMVAVFDIAAPLVFRPAILLFVAIGAAAACRELTIRDLTRPALVFPIAAGLAGLLLLIHGVQTAAHGPLDAAQDLVRRGLLAILALVTCVQLSKLPFGSWLARFEKGIFLSYLLHVPLMAILWVFWMRLVGGAESYSYLVFFCLIPMLAILAGQGLDVLADRFPAPLQILVRGKIKRRGAIGAPPTGGKQSVWEPLAAVPGREVIPLPPAAQ